MPGSGSLVVSGDWIFFSGPVFSEALPKQLRDEHFSAAHASSRRHIDCHGEAGLMGNVTSKSETRRGRLFSDGSYVIDTHSLPRISPRQLEMALKLGAPNQTFLFPVIPDRC